MAGNCISDWHVVVTRDGFNGEPLEWWAVDYNFVKTGECHQHGPFGSREELVLKCAAIGIEFDEEAKKNED